MENHSPDLAALRVEHAKRRFDDAWRNRRNDPRTVELDFDDLAVVVAMWLESVRAEAAPGAGSPG